VRLASQLTGFDVEPVKSSEYYQEELDLDEVEELTNEQYETLKKAGFKSAEEVLNGGKQSLLELTGLSEEEAGQIMAVLGNYFEESE
jgi:hypothetical protein